MGLKTNNYIIKDFDIIIPNAYARLADVSVNLSGETFGLFEIHQTREDTDNKTPIEIKTLNCIIDKDLPVHKQVYEKAKETLFINWEDDIVE